MSTYAESEVWDKDLSRCLYDIDRLDYIRWYREVRLILDVY